MISRTLVFCSIMLLSQLVSAVPDTQDTDVELVFTPLRQSQRIEPQTVIDVCINAFPSEWANQQSRIDVMDMATLIGLTITARVAGTGNNANGRPTCNDLYNFLRAEAGNITWGNDVEFGSVIRLNTTTRSSGASRFSAAVAVPVAIGLAYALAP